MSAKLILLFRKRSKIANFIDFLIINEYNNKNSTNECINHNLEQEKEEIEENLNINEEINQKE